MSGRVHIELDCSRLCAARVDGRHCEMGAPHGQRAAASTRRRSCAIEDDKICAPVPKPSQPEPPAACRTRRNQTAAESPRATGIVGRVSQCTAVPVHDGFAATRAPLALTLTLPRPHHPHPRPHPRRPRPRPRARREPSHLPSRPHPRPRPALRQVALRPCLHLRPPQTEAV